MAAVLEPRVRPDDVIVNLIGDENRPSLALHPLVHYLGGSGARIEVVENNHRIRGHKTLRNRVHEAGRRFGASLAAL